jgi:ADP-sugar diphosphatase
MSSVTSPNMLSAVPVSSTQHPPRKFLFNLPDFSPDIKVTCAQDVPDKLKDGLLKYGAFTEWLKTLRLSLALQEKEGVKDDKGVEHPHPFREDPYILREVYIQAVDYFGPNIGFLKFDAVIKNSQGEDTKSKKDVVIKNSEGDDEKKPDPFLPGKIFMRGSSVAMLMILRPNDSNDERYVIMTEQPRVPAGSLRFLGIPAGMIDGEKNFVGKAAKEIEEETGMKIPESELVDMTKLALEASPNLENLKAAMYPSPGGSDEFIALFLWEKKMERLAIEALKDQLTGLRSQGEMITLKIINYEELWRVASRDAKTMVSWALYESLKRAGKLNDNGHVVGGKPK